MKLTAFVISPIALVLTLGSGAVNASDDELSPIEELGEKIFLDKKLSLHRNQACVSCHDPKAGWTGGISEFNEHGSVYEGSINGAFGNRKPPSSAYASLAPIFYADYGNRLLGNNIEALTENPKFVGGNFWDGRATGWELGNPAADQAQGPFLNPVEQALPDAACVVNRVCESSYGELFDTVWSPNVCMITWPKNINGTCSQEDGVVELTDADRKKVDAAYDRIALSIAAFEGSKASNAFTSKIDAHRAGEYDFTPEEIQGRDIFRGKGKCGACHVGTKGPGDAPPLFTNFTYSNLGVPRNPENPFSIANPEWQDPGLAGFLETVPDFDQYTGINLGKQKVTTLRNVALGSCESASDEEDDEDEDEDDSHHGKKNGKKNGNNNNCIVKAYMHTGYFKSLKSVVHFYNTRDTKPSCESLGIDDATEETALANNCWPEPEV
ncbi:MAG: cytochrome c peroxidase, partial [Gammaproteobacteria bacterium]|nr:cytochrome c peroxidase [Gammaproteobacteria bacterium]